MGERADAMINGESRLSKLGDILARAVTNEIFYVDAKQQIKNLMLELYDEDFYVFQKKVEEL